MKVKVTLVRPFRDAVGKPEVTLELAQGGLVPALRKLADEYPGLEEQLFENGALSPYVNIYRNNVAVDESQAAALVLKDGDELLFLLPLTGG
ncbi:MAG: MoaD/ThiS family protein [Euryarchaeota archaeon]|nr:MoaD/ThiS family protein [Euryarchaeota archaeon]